jgi:hypothetical protein
MSEIRILCSGFSAGSSKVCMGTSVTVGLRKNNYTQPIENGTNKAIVATNSYDNPIYTLSNIQLVSTADLSDTTKVPITYQNILELVRMQYDNTNAPLLQITYGTSTIVPQVSGTAGPIPVILESANITFDASDSQNAYLPVASLVFVETR